jgi:NhaP-type Na+/H+ or K+/H+ antiporter
MTALLFILQALPDASTVSTVSGWLSDGYALAALIGLLFGTVIVYLSRRLMAISDERDAERRKYLDELMTRKDSDG